MKALIFLLVIVVACAAGYLTHPMIYDALEKGRPKFKVVEHEPVIAPGTVKPASADGSQPLKSNNSAATDLAQKLAAAYSAPPSTPNTTTTPSTPAAPVEDEYALRYPMPNFKTIEEITKDWTHVPSRVFPRDIKTKVDLEFTIGTAGKAKLPAGSPCVAVGMADGMLIVARNREDVLRTQVPIAGTDLKDLMISLYDKWKERQVNRIRALRAAAKYAKENPAPPPVPEDERVKMAGPKPLHDPEGRIPEMVASLEKKEVEEIRLSNILTWGPVEFEHDGNKGYWMVKVNCRVSTLFGDVDTEVAAHMAHGKVVKWFYAGSKEPVN